MSLLRSNTWDCMSLLGDPFNLVFPYFLFYRNLGAYVFYVKLENLRGIESSEGKKNFTMSFFFGGVVCWTEYILENKNRLCLKIG